MTDVAVSSPSGAPDTFRVSDNGAAAGDPDRVGDQYTSGTQVYKVSYTLHNVLNPITADGKPATDPSQADTVELYYNVFGTNETTPRDRVSITVNAPAGSTKAACYQGISRSDTAVPGHVRRPGALLRRAPRPRRRDVRARLLPAPRLSGTCGPTSARVTPGPRSAPTPPRPPTRRPGPAPSVPPSWRWP